MLFILFMHGKSVYVIQPYEVGATKRKSLAMIIPAKYARDNQIDKSTVFIVKANEQNGKIVFHRIKDIGLEELMPTGESFQASSQQESNIDIR